VQCHQGNDFRKLDAGSKYDLLSDWHYTQHNCCEVVKFGPNLPIIESVTSITITAYGQSGSNVESVNLLTSVPSASAYIA
jgi:hypothetical protein